MSGFNDIMRCERYRTAGYGLWQEEPAAECPICGSTEWDFLMRGSFGDIVGCEGCITKVYPGELNERDE